MTKVNRFIDFFIYPLYLWSILSAWLLKQIKSYNIFLCYFIFNCSKRYKI